MIRFSKFLMLLVLVSAFSEAASAQDAVVGKWKVVAETPEGDKASVWTFEKSGDKVTGSSVSGETGETAQFDDVEVGGDEVEFSIDIDMQGMELVLDLQAKVSGESLKGSWIAMDTDGNQLASGDLSGTKVAQKKKKSGKSKFAGQWNSIAVLPDGNESESVVTLTLDGKKLSGNINGDNGKTDFDAVTVTDKTIYLEFQLEVQGSPRDIEVEAELQDDGSLEGEWTLIIDDEEAASGGWSAKKKIVTEVLFDGKSMDNFRGYKKETIGGGWKIVDGTLHFDGSGGGDIITKKEYGSFELTFDWKVSEGGNSGVMYRVKQGDNAPYLTGVEYQILDNDKHADGKNRSTSAAAIYALYPPADKNPKAVGQWNKSKIVVKGNKVQHWLNGDKVASAEIGSDAWNEKIASSKFAKWKKFAKSDRGHIAFQDHGDKVWYRKIKIKAMD